MRLRVQASGFGVRGSGFRVQGSGFRVQGVRFRVQGLGFRDAVSGFGHLSGTRQCPSVPSAEDRLVPVAPGVSSRFGGHLGMDHTVRRNRDNTTLAVTLP